MISITVDVDPIQRLRLGLTGLRFQLLRPAGITQGVARGVEAQTVDRIHNTKTAPDGRKWAPWSRAYARTRNAGSGHSLLKDTWDMVGGVGSSSTTHTATVKVPAPAGYHDSDEPRTRLPQRKILGLSRQNADDLENWLAPVLEHMAAEALDLGAK